MCFCGCVLDALPKSGTFLFAGIPCSRVGVFSSNVLTWPKRCCDTTGLRDACSAAKGVALRPALGGGQDGVRIRQALVLRL